MTSVPHRRRLLHQLEALIRRGRRTAGSVHREKGTDSCRGRNTPETGGNRVGRPVRCRNSIGGYLAGFQRFEYAPPSAHGRRSSQNVTHEIEIVGVLETCSGPMRCGDGSKRAPPTRSLLRSPKRWSRISAQSARFNNSWNPEVRARNTRQNSGQPGTSEGYCGTRVKSRAPASRCGRLSIRAETEGSMYLRRLDLRGRPISAHRR